VYKVCIDASGAVASCTRFRSSGFPAYDAKIEAAVGAWTFQPFLVAGEAKPVCAVVTFWYPSTTSAP
jgi:TonB family protein